MKTAYSIVGIPTDGHAMSSAKNEYYEAINRRLLNDIALTDNELEVLKQANQYFENSLIGQSKLNIKPEKNKDCIWCGSAYHDANYHAGTCANCGGPRSEG